MNNETAASRRLKIRNLRLARGPWSRLQNLDTTIRNILLLIPEFDYRLVFTRLLAEDNLVYHGKLPT